MFDNSLLHGKNTQISCQNNNQKRKKCIFVLSMICPPNCTAMRKTIILTLLFLGFVTAGLAQTVYQKDRWGAKLLFFQDNTIRIKDRWGDPILWYDENANTLRQKDRWGQALVYMDGQTVRLKDRWGAPLLFFDGNTIRQKDRWGTPLYYLDGNTLKIKDKWGAAVYYFDFTPTLWQLAAVILM